MDGKLKISAVICTHNGGKYLNRAIESLIDQSLPKELYEIIVVDNRSTDNTKAIVESLFGKAQNLRYCYESRIGLSHARNRGIEEAKGEIIVYMDDDAYACRDFLLKYVEAYENVSPKPDAAGGKILLDWEVPKPAWFPDSMQRCLTYIDYSQEPRFLDFRKYEYPFGANMSFLKETLIRLGGFDVNLGRVGKRLLSNEEKELFFKMHERGLKVYYLPEAGVHHAVTKQRVSKDFLFKRQYWQGISDVVWYYTHASKSDHRGKALYYFKMLRERLWKLISPNKLTEGEKVKLGCELRYYLGCFVQEVRFSITGARP